MLWTMLSKKRLNGSKNGRGFRETREKGKTQLTEKTIRAGFSSSFAFRSPPATAAMRPMKIPLSVTRIVSPDSTS
jgi:hypothetical protein